MIEIDLQTWPRRELFKVYRDYAHPHFSMSANVDLTAFYPLIKQRGYSFSLAVVYLIARTANAIPEFKQRIRADRVVEHGIVHPSTTILVRNELFSFCTFEYVESFSHFAALAAEQVAYIQDHPSVENIPGRDDMLFMTSIPWVSFTSFMHPLDSHPPDSVPRFAWGKYFQEGERLKMPLSVQGHHALMDGFHLGKFYDCIEQSLRSPQACFTD
jgi:chloramphenicol O-acetyltransferase type A